MRRKRAAEEEGDSRRSQAKKQRTDKEGGQTDAASLTTTTTTTHVRFQEQYDVELSLKEYTSLCAYLCAILQWGFTLHSDRMDDFISYYESYRSWYPHLEQQQLISDVPQIPSYHTWFAEQLVRAPTKMRKDAVLDEDRLRQIWRENPFQFLRMRLFLETMALNVIGEED